MRSSDSWDSQEAVNYEVAIEAVNTAVGAFSARIAAAERAGLGDGGLEALRAGAIWCARQRRAIKPDDHDQVALARRYFTALAERLREGGAFDIDESWWRAG
jgi:hypothetical protein